MKIALTIAGSDPTGGAGIQQDLKVFKALGLYGISAVAALTAQNTGGVAAVMPVEGGHLRKQLEVLLSDITPHATKIGMLYSGENVRVVANIVKTFGLRNVVLDPVFCASKGKNLAERGLHEAVREMLLPLCAVVTPNIHEASLLSGLPIRNRDDMEAAATRIREEGPACVIVTGGHLGGQPTDVLCDGGFVNLRGRRYEGEYHGTGCTFSAALAAMLAEGHDCRAAAVRAKGFMRKAFTKSARIGTGMRLFDL